MQGDLGWGRGSGGAAGSHRAGHSALLLRPIPEPDDGGGRLGVEGSAREIVGGARLQQNHRAAVDPGVLWGDCGASRAVSQGVASTTVVTEAPGSVPPSACPPRGRLLPPPLTVTVPVAPGGASLQAPCIPPSSFPALPVDEGEWPQTREERGSPGGSERSSHPGGLAWEERPNVYSPVHSCAPGQGGEPGPLQRPPGWTPCPSPLADTSITAGRLFSPAQLKPSHLPAQTPPRATKCRGYRHTISARRSGLPQPVLHFLASSPLLSLPRPAARALQPQPAQWWPQEGALSS